MPNLIALLGHLGTQIPHPKHLAELNKNEPAIIILAPKWHHSSQIPQFVQDFKFVIAIKSLFIIWGEPRSKNPFNTTQYLGSQLHTT